MIFNSQVTPFLSKTGNRFLMNGFVDRERLSEEEQDWVGLNAPGNLYLGREYVPDRWVANQMQIDGARFVTGLVMDSRKRAGIGDKSYRLH